QGVAQQFAQVGGLPEQPTISMDDGEVTWQLMGRELHLQYKEQQTSLNLLLPAKHWAEDMALTATVALKIADELGRDWSLAEIGEALASWQPVEGRLAIHTLPHFTLIDDAYNANPASMQAALDTLANLEGHRIAMLGDMLELGDEASAIHAKLKLHNIDEVLLVGGLMAGLQTTNPERNIRTFSDAQALQTWLESHDFPAQASTVLVKSSHGTGLHQVVKQLQQRGQDVI
ncbi:MAG TPA: hypothetical protein EYP39_09665, partial [Ghiorsea sp.]|nr:hypothetical protein [Ghiorsea sp.]